jgi:hypothetical protein
MDSQETNPLLEKAVDLYRAIIAAKPMTDPMVLQMRDFLVTHFGHEGTKAYRAADGEDIVFTYKGNQQVPRKQYREYVHPLARKAEPIVSEEVTPQTEPLTGKKAAKKAAAAQQMEATIGANFQQANLQNVGEPNAPLNSPASQAGAAVEIDEGAVKDMKAKAVSQMYSLEHLRVWADQHGIQRDEKTSHVQLASLIIHYLNNPV